MPYGETWKCWDCLQGCSPSPAVHRNKQLCTPATWHSTSFSLSARAAGHYEVYKNPRLCVSLAIRRQPSICIVKVHTWFNLWKNTLTLCTCTFSIIDSPLPYKRANIWGLTTAWQLGQESSKSVHFKTSWIQLLLVVFWYLVKQLRGTQKVPVAAHRKCCYC